MSGLFFGATSSDMYIGSWDTRSVTNMASMFEGATSFNQDISPWDTRSVTNMASMFEGATSFNQNISAWTASPTSCPDFSSGATAWIAQYGGGLTTSPPLSTSMIAAGCSTPYYVDPNGVTVKCPGVVVGRSFILDNVPYTRRDLAGLLALVISANEAELARSCTTDVTDMHALFSKAPGGFNPDISSWDTSSVIDMSSMFKGMSAFDQDISAWDTSSVIDMSSMFSGASTFNKDISGWDTSSVTNMSEMFMRASTFNQSIGDWDTYSVYNMARMFLDAPSFNQDLRAWHTDACTSCFSFSSGASSWYKPRPTFLYCSPRVENL